MRSLLQLIAVMFVLVLSAGKASAQMTPSAGAEFVASFSQVAVYPPNVAQVNAIRAAVDTARAENRGVWSGSAFRCMPADYRAGRCR